MCLDIFITTYKIIEKIIKNDSRPIISNKRYPSIEAIEASAA